MTTTNTTPAAADTAPSRRPDADANPSARGLHWLRTALVAVVLGALVLGGCSAFGGDDGYQITADFDRAYVLFPGSTVRVLGVPVGKINEVEISEESDTVRVTLDIDGDRAIPQDVRAVIIPETLLGERYIQLDPPFTGGATLEPGANIPVERTVVPAEFDEILESLNRFVGGLDEDEVARFASNLAEVLDGQGTQFGETIDAAYRAIQVLNDEDEDLISLATRLSDLNETIASRDDEIATLLTNYNILVQQIVDEEADLDASLTGLSRLTTELADLMRRQRPGLERDIETLTRLTRSTNRNLDQISLAILSSAELFGHAERVFVFEENMLPLVNHDNALANALAESIEDRLVGLCLRVGIDAEQCEQIPLDELVPDNTCLDPIVPCPESDGGGGDGGGEGGDGGGEGGGEPGLEDLPLPTAPNSVGAVVRDVIESVPGFDQALRLHANELLSARDRQLLADVLGIDARDEQEVTP